MRVWNELIRVCDFKKVLFTWSFISAAHLMGMCRHFISGSVYKIFYHPKWNFISGVGLKLPPNFEKGGVGCCFYIKNKLKYEIFNDKKGL